VTLVAWAFLKLLRSTEQSVNHTRTDTIHRPAQSRRKIRIEIGSSKSGAAVPRTQRGKKKANLLPEIASVWNSSVQWFLLPCQRSFSEKQHKRTFEAQKKREHPGDLSSLVRPHIVINAPAHRLAFGPPSLFHFLVHELNANIIKAAGPASAPICLYLCLCLLSVALLDCAQSSQTPPPLTG
jgi:hypothetical protein